VATFAYPVRPRPRPLPRPLVLLPETSPESSCDDNGGKVLGRVGRQLPVVGVAPEPGATGTGGGGGTTSDCLGPVAAAATAEGGPRGQGAAWATKACDDDPLGPPVGAAAGKDAGHRLGSGSPSGSARAAAGGSSPSPPPPPPPRTAADSSSLRYSSACNIAMRLSISSIRLRSSSLSSRDSPDDGPGPSSRRSTTGTSRSLALTDAGMFQQDVGLFEFLDVWDS
jgi:hypothetical protein